MWTSAECGQEPISWINQHIGLNVVGDTVVVNCKWWDLNLRGMLVVQYNRGVSIGH